MTDVTLEDVKRIRRSLERQQQRKKFLRSVWKLRRSPKSAQRKTPVFETAAHIRKAENEHESRQRLFPPGPSQKVLHLQAKRNARPRLDRPLSPMY